MRLQMSKSSSIRHFFLLALANTRQLQLLHFCLLLGISLAALLGNSLIISAVACGHHLHTPMFFFLLNLALSDLGSICTTVHGNALDQFFCDIPQILRLSCYKSYLRELGLIVVSAFLLFGCFVFMVFSYVQIFRAVLRIPSEQGQHKAFSTCLPHLPVLSLFLCTAIFANLKPPHLQPEEPGAQGWHEKNDDWMLFRRNEGPLFASVFRGILMIFSVTGAQIRCVS
ncbi:olfactory receptor 14A16-like [Molothrus aeneus]|uniref:olfactory receptor 14A16-like n=1 Tax=Molothrus aeneus TaxID=84833 RepID=UPI00345AB356